MGMCLLTGCAMLTPVTQWIGGHHCIWCRLIWGTRTQQRQGSIYTLGLGMGVGGIWGEGDRKGYPLRKRVVAILYSIVFGLVARSLKP